MAAAVLSDRKEVYIQRTRELAPDSQTVIMHVLNEVRLCPGNESLGRLTTWLSQMIQMNDDPEDTAEEVEPEVYSLPGTCCAE